MVGQADDNTLFVVYVEFALVIKVARVVVTAGGQALVLALALVANSAVTFCAAVIDTVQVFDVPLHAPLQPENTDPLDGVAVNVTLLATYSDAVQVPVVQEIPPLLDVTVPLPEPLSVTDKM